MNNEKQHYSHEESETEDTQKEATKVIKGATEAKESAQDEHGGKMRFTNEKESHDENEMQKFSQEETSKTEKEDHSKETEEESNKNNEEKGIAKLKEFGQILKDAKGQPKLPSKFVSEIVNKVSEKAHELGLDKHLSAEEPVEEKSNEETLHEEGNHIAPISQPMKLQPFGKY